MIMRTLTVAILVLFSLAAFSQNNQVANPPDDQQINPPAQFVMNTDIQNNINIQGTLANESKNKQVQQQQKVNVNWGNVFDNDNSDRGYNPPKPKWGQSIQVASGYSGSSGSSSGAKHKSNKLFSEKFKNTQKVFRHKFKEPKHYAHKNRVHRCAQF
jgi:hypothetical protein